MKVKKAQTNWVKRLFWLPHYSHFTVSAIIQIHSLVGLKFYMCHIYIFQQQIFQLNVYFSQSYCTSISVYLVRIKSVKFSKAKAHALLTEKLTNFYGFLTITDGEYTCEMQVMHLWKEHIAQNSASLSAAHAIFLSEHLTGWAALNWNYKL